MNPPCMHFIMDDLDPRLIVPECRLGAPWASIYCSPSRWSYLSYCTVLLTDQSKAQEAQAVTANQRLSECKDLH